MQHHTFLLTALALLFITLSFTPKKNEYKKQLQDAEYYFLYEDYQEALYLYKSLDTAGYSNANIKYRIGMCYVHSQFEKEKAIPYFKQALQNISEEYDEADLFESSAPQETFYYLGKAYLVANQLDSATRYFGKYRDILPRDDLNSLFFVNNEILSCRIARQLKPRSEPVEFTNAGAPVNSEFSDYNPLLPAGGDKLIYISSLKFYDAIFFSRRIEGKWSSPVNITPQIGTDGKYLPCFLSFDGNTLLLVKESIFESNIYISEYSRQSGQWSKATEIKGNVNSSNWETHACLSPDGKTMYFTSNRPGGYGGMDVYRSTKNSHGTWDKPTNLGAQINTPFNEASPFITENSERLYFSSQGHYSMGGYDVFYAEKNRYGEWTIPVNLGYPLNTTDDNMFFYPLENGRLGYISTYRGDSRGKSDIYQVRFNAD